VKLWQFAAALVLVPAARAVQAVARARRVAAGAPSGRGGVEAP
jgi:hypothetical protein